MTTLPEVLIKPLDEIKTASNRLLLISLFIALGTISTAYFAIVKSQQGDYIKAARKQAIEIAGLRTVIVDMRVVMDSMRNDALKKMQFDKDKGDLENKRLIADGRWKDSLYNALARVLNTKSKYR